MAKARHIIAKPNNWVRLAPFTWSPWYWIKDLMCYDVATDASGTHGWGAEWGDKHISGVWTYTE